MMRSLYSGVSGLRNHQTRMDVIGNNIANVNTVGYKTSRVVFQDIFSQLAAGGSASNPDFNLGGTNSKQIGLGIKLSSIDVMHTAAAFQRSDNPFDMMIGGDGFFIVRGPDGDFYTRAGNFKTDDQGYLTNSDGYFVMGFPANVFAYTGDEKMQKYAVNPLYNKTYSDGTTAWADMTDQERIDLWDAADGAADLTDDTISQIDRDKTWYTNMIENEGAFFEHDTEPWKDVEYGIRYDPPQFELKIDVNRDNQADPKSPILFSERLDKIQLRAYHKDYIPGVTEVDEDGYFTVSMMLPDPANPSTLIATDVKIKAWDDLEGFSVGKNGEISVIANNRKLTIAKVALAMFMNPGGLEKAGNSLYRQTNASGEAEIGSAYDNGAGSIEGGGLEMSNVDLAAEFTDMIVTQRGFQANARTITVSDTLLEELINLKR